MSELNDFTRWQKDAGAHQVTAAVNRWRKMSDESKQALRKKWDIEDAEQAKIIQIEGKK